MSQAEEAFEAWWQIYEANKTDMKQKSFKEVAKDAWMASDDATSKRDIKEFVSIIFNRDEE